MADAACDFELRAMHRAMMDGAEQDEIVFSMSAAVRRHLDVVEL